MSDPPKLVLLVVNRCWECDPVLAALLGDASPSMLHERWPTLYDWPRPRRNPPRGGPPVPTHAATHRSSAMHQQNTESAP